MGDGEFIRWENDMQEILLQHVGIDTFNRLSAELARITLPYFMEAE